ncbi:hypothetical protein MMC07_005235 [Pseudocyphellaria aurata]|nr:hypothetical protein [Pseudocyphellaria aurata]
MTRGKILRQTQVSAMSNNISSECAAKPTKPLAFGRPMSNKYVFGVTNALGASSEDQSKQSKSSSSVASGQSQNAANHIIKKAEIEGPAVPVLSSGDEESKPMGLRRFLNKNQVEVPRVAKSQETSTCNSEYLAQSNHLKKSRDDNERGKEAQDLAQSKEIAKIVIRAELEGKPNEHVELEERAMAILATQTALMAKILEDTKASLRQLFAQQMKEEIYAGYDKTAAAHREEIRAELIRKLTPEVKAALKSEHAAQAKNGVAEEEQNNHGDLVDEPPEGSSLSGRRWEGKGGGRREQPRFRRPWSLKEDAIDLDSSTEAITRGTPQKSPSSLRGVKRSLKQEDNGENHCGHSPKRARSPQEEDRGHSSKRARGSQEEEGDWESFEAPVARIPRKSPSSLRGVKRLFEQGGKEEDYRGTAKSTNTSREFGDWESFEAPVARGGQADEEEDYRGPTKSTHTSREIGDGESFEAPVARGRPLVDVSNDDEEDYRGPTKSTHTSREIGDGESYEAPVARGGSLVDVSNDEEEDYRGTTRSTHTSREIGDWESFEAPVAREIGDWESFEAPVARGGLLVDVSNDDEEDYRGPTKSAHTSREIGDGESYEAPVARGGSLVDVSNDEEEDYRGPTKSAPTSREIGDWESFEAPVARGGVIGGRLERR